MSLLWKSELRLHLAPHHCDAAVWVRARQGWRWQAQLTYQARGQGSGRVAVEAALEALSLQGVEIPKRVRVVLGDDCLYFELMPVQLGAWAEVPKQALAHFAKALGHEALYVRHAMAPGGRAWLLAAIESTLLDAWLAVLFERGLRPVAIQPELMVDLARVQRLMPATRRRMVAGGGRVWAFVREHGVMVVPMSAAGLDDVIWHRLDWRQTETLWQRLQPLAGPQAFLIAATPAQHQLLAPQAREQGWLILGSGVGAVA
ncbi:MAG: hypothetical protein AB3X41_08610 [Leptothrix ochracea]|uniref:hypothetical protein n=1 Tax=Leptothrix ochracea TaxID=735331 RepID=UPI0034E2C419